jgi:alpha 1,2-mannosyltransferase
MLKKTTSLISYRLSRRKYIYFSFLFFSFLWLLFYTIPHNPIRDGRCLKPIPVEGDYLSNIDYYESPDTHIHPSTWDSLPLKGAFYMLVRNEDLQAARTAMQSLEERFNYAKGYPWILLNPQSFTSDFKRYARRVTQSKVYFGKIDLDAWVPPYWIDIEMAERLMMGLYKRKVPNAMSMSFHQEVR